jgi:hypothetical protein
MSDKKHVSKKRAAANGRPARATCSAIPAIESAYLNLGTAKSDCDWARHYWVLENWPDALMHIREAIAQLESAKAKIEAHTKPNTNLSGAAAAFDRKTC